MAITNLQIFKGKLAEHGYTFGHIANSVGISRPTLYAWIAHPEKITIGAWERLEVLGLVDTIQALHRTHYALCSACGGKGYIEVATKGTDMVQNGPDKPTGATQSRPERGQQ